MNRIALFMVAAFSLGAGLTAKSDVTAFGNSPNGGNGFGIVVYNELSLSGGAVEFTPFENIDLSSATLWLSGYTGQYGQSIYANIWLNSGANAPGTQYISLGTAAHNDGSLAAFNFSSLSANTYSDPSGSTVLDADTSYWLVVTASGQPGNYMAEATWAGGGNPDGVATYDGADNYNVYGGSFSPSADLPAFSINSPSQTILIQEVPEPDSAALLTIPALLGLSRKFWLRRPARS
jgi:hypothetical protein